MFLSSLRLKEERHGMRCLLLLFVRLILFPQFFDERTYLSRFRIRKRICASEIKIVAQPFPILRVAGYGNRPRLKGGLIVSPNIIWDQLHRMVGRTVGDHG